MPLRSKHFWKLCVLLHYLIRNFGGGIFYWEKRNEVLFICFGINGKKLTLRTSIRLFIKLGYHIMQKDRYLKYCVKAAFLTNSEILLSTPFETGLIEKQEHFQKCSYLRIKKKKIKCTDILPDLFWRYLLYWFFQHTSRDHLKSHECFHYYKYICLHTFTSYYNISPCEAEQQSVLFSYWLQNRKLLIRFQELIKGEKTTNYITTWPEKSYSLASISHLLPSWNDSCYLLQSVTQDLEIPSSAKETN